MTSEGHDLIVEMIKLKMKAEGYIIVASEGKYRNREIIKTKIPPAILRHRPDVIGYNRLKRFVLIGEAKYFGDIKSKRTQQQIEDFGNLARERKDVYVIFGFPLSEEKEFLLVLKEKKLKKNKKIMLLKVPDKWVKSDEKR